MPTQPPNKTPTDSYAQASELQAPAAAPPPAPPPADPLEKSCPPPEHYTSWTERTMHTLFLLMVALAVLVIVVWLDLDVHSKVISSRSIGHFQRMSGPGGLLREVVIETETGSYPLWGAPVVAQGTPLVLEVRESGNRYICDEPRSLCIETTGKEFKASNTTKGATP